MSITALQYIQNSKQSNSFVGVFRYIKSSGVKSTKEGDLYGFLQISSEGDFPAERVAHMAWDGVVEGYMYSKTKSVSDSLKSGITEFTRRLKDLMRNSKELEQIGIDVSLVIIATTKDGIYIANIGENEIFAYKGGKIVNVNSVLGKNNAQTAGFAINRDDLVVISTNSLLTENMHTLVGKASKEEILKSVNLLSKTLLPDQAILCLHSEGDAKILPQEESFLEPSINTKTGVKKTSVVEKVEEIKPLKKDGVNLRKIILVLIGILKKIFTFFSIIFKKVSLFLKRIFLKLGEFFKKKFGNQRWFKKYAAKASEMRMGSKRSPNIRIDGYKTKDLRFKRFRIAILATLGVVVLVGGYQYTRKMKALRELHNQADEVLDEIEGKIDSAKEKLSTDRDSAQTYIFSAKNLFEEVPDGIDEEHLERVGSLESQILEVEDGLYKRFVVEPESFVGFFESGSKPQDIKYFVDSSSNEWLLVSDSGRGVVYRVSVFNKESSEMADNNGLLESPMFLDIGVDADIFVYDSNVGVLKATLDGSSWGAFEKLTGVGVSNIKIDNVAEFGVYADSDNLYYLDNVNGKITKSVNYGSGYSSTTVVSVDDSGLVGANDFFADFSIYGVTSGIDGVPRYTSGEPKPVTLSGVGDLGTLCCGDTSIDQNYGLYVFDSSNRSVLRFEKPKDGYNDKLHPNELVLLKQYVYRGDDSSMWGDVKDIEVDRLEKNIYILDGNRVWRVPL